MQFLVKEERKEKISWNVINSLNDEDDAMTITRSVYIYTFDQGLR